MAERARVTMDLEEGSEEGWRPPAGVVGALGRALRRRGLEAF